jgi:tRNA-2-methylthio-N6-dimethylallyladenosine synthase
MTYFILAAGCQMNLSDAERIRTVLNIRGFTEVSEDSAELLGVVACSVRQKSIDKIYSRIRKWNMRKKNRPVITFLTGCVLPDDREKFLGLFDLVFETKEILQLPEMVEQYGVVTGLPESSPEHSQEDFWHVSPTCRSDYEAYIPIQNGCDNFCSFCAVPFTRGREISRDPDEIADEFSGLADRGFRTITLLGQNVNSYGKDFGTGGPGFADLLDRLGRIGDSSGHPLWIYFTAPHPKDMNDSVIDVMASHRSIARQLHLPLQSGDNAVLKQMNRHYTVEDFGRIIETVNGRIPDMSLFTDIIVGFPGETDEQFEKTRRAFDQFRFDMAFIARYSPRPGAASARREDDIPHEVKKERLAVLSGDLKRISEEKHRGMRGREVQVLVTGMSRDGTFAAGLTEGKINIQFASGGPVSPGETVTVRVTQAEGLSLRAGPVSSSRG